MFSSILPSMTSSLKFTQSGQSKAANRFSVRVFKAPNNSPFPYTLNAKATDVPFRTMQHQNSSWFPPNIYGSYDQQPRTAVNYAIYPSSTNDTFIYEQSSSSKSDILSTSELDTASSTTFSPSSPYYKTFSNDSTATLQGTPAPVTERLVEESRPIRPPTPAVIPRSNYTSAAPQGLSRAPSTSRHPVTDSVDSRPSLSSSQGRSSTPFRVPASSTRPTEPNVLAASVYLQVPEYEASSMSEMEIDERSRIAKINAGYNAATSTSLFIPPNGLGEIDRRHVSSQPQNLSNAGQSTFARVASSQPLHPNLQFAVRPQDSDTRQSNFHNTINFPASIPPQSIMRHDSPPKVERLPSERTDHYQVPFIRSQSPGESRYRDPSPPSITRERSSSRAIPSVYIPQESSRAPFLQTSAQIPVAGPLDTSSLQPRSEYSNIIQDTNGFGNRSQDRSEDLRGPQLRSSFMDRDRDENTEGRHFPIPHSVQDYRALPKSESDSSSLTAIDYIPSGDRHLSREASTRETIKQSMAPEIKREPRPSIRRESSERLSSSYRPRDSIAVQVDNSATSPRDSRPETRASRESYRYGPLTSSPTQLHPTIAEQNSGYGRGGGQQVGDPTLAYADIDRDRSTERTRKRSNSFPANVRPPALSTQNSHYSTAAQHQPTYPSSTSDNRHVAPGTERHSRSYERSPIGEPKNRKPSVEPERRTDTYVSAPQASYYPATAEQDRHASQRPTTPVLGRPASRVADRAVSSQQNTPVEIRSGVSHDPRARPRPDTVQSDRNIQPSTASTTSYRTYPQPQHDKKATSSKVVDNRSGGTQGSTGSEPQRRYSDGDQNPPLPRQNLSGRNSAPLLRSVRWNDNLICASPGQRRKGWFNRRGDQLWTNNGEYKSPPAGQDYPPDLDDYPEEGEGWMNEEGTRIDLNHRLIPRAPLRSALKQPRV